MWRHIWSMAPRVSSPARSRLHNGGHNCNATQLVIVSADRPQCEEFLDYGNIDIHAWIAIAFLVPALPWGAFPGRTIERVGGGIGTVHNGHLIANVERSVITGPSRLFPRSLFAGEFAMSPKPGWFVKAHGADNTARDLTSFEKTRGWPRLPAVVAAAMRG